MTINTLLRKILLACLCIIAIPTFAGAAEGQKDTLRIGIGAGGATSEYKETDSQIWPVPLLNYEGERFYVRGLTGGIFLYKNSTHELSLNISYLPQSFDASDSDSRAMRQLDDRYSTMLAGASYRLKSEYGIANLSVSGDVLGTSNGILADLSYAYPIPAISIFQITPAAGVTWTSSNYNDYYYGVSGKESRKSGLGSYDADDGFSPYAGINIKAGITENFDILLNGKAVYLSEEIRDSPMVDKDIKYYFSAGFTYSF